MVFVNLSRSYLGIPIPVPLSGMLPAPTQPVFTLYVFNDLEYVLRPSDVTDTVPVENSGIWCMVYGICGVVRYCTVLYCTVGVSVVCFFYLGMSWNVVGEGRWLFLE
jgi:hypothetical protein